MLFTLQTIITANKNMLEKIKNKVSWFISKRQITYEIKHVKSEPSWITSHFFDVLTLPLLSNNKIIEERVFLTKKSGMRPLWEGYAKVLNYPFPTTGFRTSDQVSIHPGMGQIFAWIARERKPTAIIEVGTAFGISGMYWLSGMQECGTFYTFEPNHDWAFFAESNLLAISNRFVLTGATFEESASTVLEGLKADIAFIDAIHTSESVFTQYAILKPYLNGGALVLFDDIGFSADMKECWKQLAYLPEVKASVQINNRVGIVELY